MAAMPVLLLRHWLSALRHTPDKSRPEMHFEFAQCGACRFAITMTWQG